jgi:outer membrane protein
MKRLAVSWVIVVCFYSFGYGAGYTLDDLYRIAMERAEKIKITEEDVYIAETTREKAQSLLMPRLSGQGNYLRYNSTAVGSTGLYVQPLESQNYAFRVDQSMSLSGREITAYGIAKKNIERSKYDLYAVKESYIITVAASFYDYMKFKKIRDIAQSNVERLTKHRDAAAVRLKIGEVTKTALLRAQAELSGAQSDLVKAGNAQKLSKAVLERIVGLEGESDIMDDPVTVKREERESEGIVIVQGCQPMTPECLKEKAYSERAELKSLTTQKKMAEDQVKFVEGANWPTISAEGVYSRNAQTPETSGLVHEVVYGGIRLSVPIFEGGLRVAEKREALAKLRQVELSLSDTKKTVGIEVDGAYLDFVTQKGVLVSLEDQYLFAKDNYSAVERQFEYGLANSVDVMDANNSLVTAEIQLVQAMYNYQLSVLRVKRSTGVFLKSVASRSRP